MSPVDLEGRSPREECESTREILWPLDRPRAYSEEEEVARRHLRDCKDCRAWFRRDRLIGQWLRERALPVELPEGLRERVYDTLARERAAARDTEVREEGRRPSFPSWTRVATAILVGLVIVGLGVLWSGRVPARASDPYVEDFVGRMVAERAVESDDPRVLARFFLREMGLSVPPVQLRTGEPVRAMICLIEGRLAAMVEYRVDGHAVAHYRLPRAGAGASRTLGRSEDRGVHVVRWVDDRFEHALVSELPGASLARLAREEFGASPALEKRGQARE